MSSAVLRRHGFYRVGEDGQARTGGRGVEPAVPRGVLRRIDEAFRVRHEAEHAAGRVAGSGDVLARASGQAAISVAGSGDVTVTGGAKCTKRVAGSGDVTCS